MVTKLPFGTGIDGEAASLYKIENADGSYAAITDYGATVTQIVVPDKSGVLRNVVMGHSDVQGYQKAGGFWGATIGRVGNRLGASQFEINGKTYRVLANDGPNHLHGGAKGFDKRMWEGEIVDENSVKFSRISPDGEEGYPGTLTVSVTFTFDADHRLTIAYHAVSDADTLCNLTNHSYFNLNGTTGESAGLILGHLMQINAARMTACSPDLLPTGELLPVDGTPFDFRTPKPIGQDIDADNITSVWMERGSGRRPSQPETRAALPWRPGPICRVCSSFLLTAIASASRASAIQTGIRIRSSRRFS